MLRPYRALCVIYVSDEEDTQENTSYSCSNMNSPKKQNPAISENSCVCGTKSTNKTPTLDHSINLSGLHSKLGR